MTFLKALPRTLLSTALFATASLANAQSLKLERVAQPPSVTFDNQTQSFSVDLSEYLDVPGVTGQVVLIETDLGDIAIEMLPEDAPKTVEAMLSYITEGFFDETIIHRSVPGFVIQGGGFTETLPMTDLPLKPTVVNEYKRSNLRGTLAMAKIGGKPDSATSGWFINLADNSDILNSQNGGFTVFARVIGTGMEVADDIAALQRYNLGATTPFTEIPMERLLGNTPLTVEDLVAIPTMQTADLFPEPASLASFVAFTEVTSSNPAVAQANPNNFHGSLLTLPLGIGAVGSSEITVTAEDPNGNEVALTFTVTLEAAFVTLNANSQELGAAATSYEIAIDSNTAWEVVGKPDWITLTPSSGDGDATLAITVAANESQTPRFGAIDIEGAATVTHQSVYQRGNYDAWLATYFTAPEIAAMTPNTFDADSDGDGLSNGVENALGLDPNAFDSQLQTRLEIVDDQRTLEVWPVTDGVSLVLETSPGLANWTPQPAATATADDEPNTFTFFIENEETRFYRVQLESPFFVQEQE